MSDCALAVRRGKYRLRAAATDGQLLIVPCSHCHRTTHFLATDLVAFVDPGEDAKAPPFPCSKCGRKDYIRVTLRLPSSGDYGHLEVRRLGPVRKTQTWRTVKLGG